MEDVDGFGGRIVRLMSSPSFGDVVKRLERGVHICPEDGERYYFIRRNFDDLATYFRLAFRSELIDRNWFHLDGHVDYYGRRQLLSCDVVTGTALALTLHSPERLQSGGVPLSEFVDGIKGLLGGDEQFVSVYRPRMRASGSPERRVASAEEECGRSIRRLVRLGFARLWAGPAGRLIDPREPCHRFAEVIRVAPDATEDGIAAAIAQLLGSGRLGAVSSVESQAEDDDEV